MIGPLLGGLLTDNVSWRWCFYVNVPLAAIVIVARPVHRSRRSPAAPSRASTTLGMATVALGASMLVLATSFGGTTYAWGSWQIIGLLVGGVAVLGVFVLVELRAAEPILPLRLFRSKVFADCCALAFVVGFTMLGAMTFLPTFFQYVEGVDRDPVRLPDAAAGARPARHRDHQRQHRQQDRPLQDLPGGRADW